MRVVEVVDGEGPLVLGLPHTGIELEPEIAALLTPVGQQLADTDWHVHRLYDGLVPDTSIVRAKFHRYVIDPNRDPSGSSLYPGQNTTELVPLTTFDGLPLWLTPPDSGEIERRLTTYHAAYHRELARAMERARARHGVAILYDCHSIRSQIPFLFEGTLPDFNIGTNEGSTCAPVIEQAAIDACTAAQNYTTVINGRFKGGWTTRHYGRPDTGFHAIQMELAQSTHLAQEHTPFHYDDSKAAALRPILRRLLNTLVDLAPHLRDQS